MANWSEPIFDRTLADVEYAKQQLANNINNVDFKGCFNAKDILRIENNARYLADTLNNLCYRNNITTQSSWTVNSIPDVTNIVRIINNVSKLINAYYKPNNAPTLPTTLLTYEQVNALEKNLYLIKEILDNMIASFRECGTFVCGEE